MSPIPEIIYFKKKLVLSSIYEEYMFELKCIGASYSQKIKLEMTCALKRWQGFAPFQFAEDTVGFSCSQPDI